MPDSSDNYQLPSWPPTPINRELWNAVLGSIGERLTAREDLEADFEALIAQGTQASLDYIQATVAPQIASLQTSIQLAQEQIDQIIVDGIAPNAAKLGGQLPAYYATAASVTALSATVALKADTSYLDAELLDLANATQALLDLKASIAALNLKANAAVSITGAGLATGGGDLSANRIITVPKATDAEHQARVRDDVAATPKGVGLAVDAILNVSGRLFAHVNFNGVGGATVRGSKNVLSVTRTGLGRYAVTVISPMPNVNYSVCVTAGSGTGIGVNDQARNVRLVHADYTTTSFSFGLTNVADNAFVDAETINVQIFV